MPALSLLDLADIYPIIIALVQKSKGSAVLLNTEIVWSILAAIRIEY
jgi:hypothetical protein